VALFYGDQYNNSYYHSTRMPTPPETGDAYYMNSGNDTVVSGYGNDQIHLQDGNDVADGGYGSDLLLGGNGYDTLWGGVGNDYLFGEAGNDHLIGESGSDSLSGGMGDDSYYHSIGDGGQDLIVDDRGPAWGTGYGGGTDVIYFQDVNGADLAFYQSGNHLIISSASDTGALNGVKIENFFLGGNNVIEYAVGADSTYWDLTYFL